jgi:signal transduction histidine kinase
MLAIAVIPSFSFATLAFLFQKYRRWSSTSLLWYVGEVSVGQSFLFICAPIIKKFLKEKYNFEYEAALTLTIWFWFSSLMIILIVLALLHRAELSIIRRLEKADKLTLELQKAREKLVLSDEELRRQTSQFLHDRVQSDLMVVAMKLKSIQGQTSPEVDVVIRKAIASLESTRTADLRNLVQVLTPNFTGAGLGEALKKLRGQYHSSMEVLVEFSPDLETLSEGQKLGIFRIAEQALLNSLVHGPASEVQISITADNRGVISLQVSDNGPGAQVEEIKSGVGSAIVDSWVSILKGKKEVVTKPGEGYSISVTFNR